MENGAENLFVAKTPQIQFRILKGSDKLGRSRQPIELIEAKGKKHLTKAEIEERKSNELKVDLKDVEIPSYLPSKLKKEFEDISSKLLYVGIMTELDEDTLGRYLLAKEKYLKYTKLLNKAMRESDIFSMEKLTSMQDKAFKQCRACANDLGLTIASRCKLVVPKSPDPPKKNKFLEKFGDDRGKER